MEMGDRIRHSRQHKHLLQSELAKMIGVKSSGIISNWERGLNRPNADQIISLCKALNITASYLLDYSGKSDLEATPEEADTIRKLRKLDDFGLKSVSCLIENELERCISKEEAI